MPDHVVADRIVVSRTVLHGKPRIQGTRIPVYQVPDLLASGKTITEVLSEDYYPDLSEADVLACIAYASQIIQNEVIVHST